MDVAPGVDVQMSGISVSDIDAGDSSLQVTIAASHGTLTVLQLSGITFSAGDGTSDVTMTFSGSQTDINVALATLHYRSDAGYAGGDALSITVDDQAHNGVGNYGLPLIASKTLDLMIGNQAPTDINLSSSNVAENQPAGTTVGAFSTTDPNFGDIHTYSLVSGAGDTDNGWFTIQGNVLKTNVNFDYEMKNSYSIRVRVTDAGGLTHEEPFSINITDGNEPPVATGFDPSPTNLGEDFSGTYAFPLRATPVEASQTVTFHFADVSSLHGSLYRNSNATGLISLSDTIAASAPGAATVNVYYRPDLNYNGPVSFQYYATDDGVGTNQSANATDSTFILPINDAPTITVPWSVYTVSDPITFSSANGNSISISDVDVNDAGVAVETARLVATHGVITLHGTTGLVFSVGDGSTDTEMIFQGTINNINAALNGLVFTPTDSVPSLGNLLISVADSVQSGMGAVVPGQNTVDIYINNPAADANDALVTLFNEVSTPFTGLTTPANTPLTFGAASGRVISLSDPDAGAEQVQVTLYAGLGSITLSQTDGLTFINGDGINTGWMCFQGTMNYINAALDGMVFQPRLDACPAVQSIQIGVNDLGHTGSGHPKGDFDVINVSVTGILNQAPVNTVSGSLSTAVDAPIVFSRSG